MNDPRDEEHLSRLVAWLKGERDSLLETIAGGINDQLEYQKMCGRYAQVSETLSRVDAIRRDEDIRERAEPLLSVEDR